MYCNAGQSDTTKLIFARKHTLKTPLNDAVVTWVCSRQTSFLPISLEVSLKDEMHKSNNQDELESILE